MLTAMKQFQNSVELGNSGCIKRVLRIKNTLKQFALLDENETDLSKYNYWYVHCTRILLEYCLIVFFHKFDLKYVL